MLRTLWFSSANFSGASATRDRAISVRIPSGPRWERSLSLLRKSGEPPGPSWGLGRLGPN
eukprot:5024059-Pyramimonas_sp.AAC.1